MTLPLKIQNTQMLPSSFSISRVLYGANRKDEFTIDNSIHKNSIIIDINDDIKNNNKTYITKTDSVEKNNNDNINNNPKIEKNDDNENEENLGSVPAKNSAELSLRIDQIINNKMKLKKEKHPEPFSIKMKKKNENIDRDDKKLEIVQFEDFVDNDKNTTMEKRGGCCVHGYSSVVLDVVCAPLVIGKYC